MKAKKLSNLRRTVRNRGDLPTLSLSDIAERWCLDPDTARSIILDYKLRPVPGPWKRKRYNILDVWRVEKIPEWDIETSSLKEELLEPLLTANDLAEMLNYTPTTIRNWARQERLPGIRLGGSVRFHAYAIQSLFEEI